MSVYKEIQDKYFGPDVYVSYGKLMYKTHILQEVSIWHHQYTENFVVLGIYKIVWGYLKDAFSGTKDQVIQELVFGGDLNQYKDSEFIRTFFKVTEKVTGDGKHALVRYEDKYSDQHFEVYLRLFDEGTIQQVPYSAYHFDELRYKAPDCLRWEYQDKKGVTIYRNSIVRVQKDCWTDDGLLKCHISSTDKNIQVLCYSISKNKVVVNTRKLIKLCKVAQKHTFTLKGNKIHHDVENVEHPDWFDSFVSPNDLAPNPFNISAQEQLQFGEGNDPLYKSECTWIDRNGQVYAKLQGEWIDLNAHTNDVQCATRRLPESVLLDIQRHFLLQEMLK